MSKSIALFAAAALLLAACITINIYFPEAEAQAEADRIIDEVRGISEENQDVQEHTGWQGAPITQRLALAAVNLIIPPAHAQGRANFDGSSPAKRALEAALKERFPSLKSYYDSGAIGLTAEGTIEMRDRAGIPLNERNKVRQLVSEQNADWDALYKEIARINEHPEWEDEIRSVFADRWIAKASQGWYYRDSNGNWQQK